MTDTAELIETKDYAFPSIMPPASRDGSCVPFGLTKRELFAAMAMQGMCAADQTMCVPSDHIAQWSVQTADALITALHGGADER